MTSTISKKQALLILSVNDLGEAVTNDGTMFKSNLKQLGYETENLLNPTVKEMKDKLINFLDNGTGQLLIYYSGHGVQLPDKNNDEIDGKDEAFVLKNFDLLLDDDIGKIIKEHFHGEKLILIADACHSGTIWDTNGNDKIIILNSCLDYQTSKQLIKNGCFTLQFWLLYDKNKGSINIKELNRRLNWFDQKVTSSLPGDNILLSL